MATLKTRITFVFLTSLSCFGCLPESKEGSGDAPYVQCAAPLNPQQDSTAGFGIVNGVFRTDFPEVVMLTINEGPQFAVCTGTFIGHNTIATAGHCVNGATPANVKVHFGPQFNPQLAVNQPSSAPVLQILSALPPNNLDATPEVVAIDFAILITAPNSAPAIANISQTPVAVSENFQIVGYGSTTDRRPGTGTGVKRWAQTAMIDNGFTDPLVRGAIFTGEIQRPGITQLGRIAQGDSGGPLFDQQLNLVGISSIGITLPAAIGGTRNVSGFNSVASDAAIQILEQAKNNGAQIGHGSNNDHTGGTYDPQANGGSPSPTHYLPGNPCG